MALIDLAKYDILDLLCTSFMTDEEKGSYIYDYMDAFAQYLSEKVADQFTDEDQTNLENLLKEPTTTPEIVEKFYKDRVPDYDSLLLVATLTFKKAFLLDFYRGMLEETTKQNDPTVHLCVKIVASADEDNWDQINTLITTLSENYLKLQTPPAEVKTEQI